MLRLSILYNFRPLRVTYKKVGDRFFFRSRTVSSSTNDTGTRDTSKDFIFPVIGSDRKLNDLGEFLTNSNRDYLQALSEIKAGRKSSHWIWYIYPQLALFGSPHGNSAFFGLKSLPEAQMYLQDPVLGKRLVEITEAAMVHLRNGTNINRLMGSSIDASKLLSCATLFTYASDGHSAQPLFRELKEKCENLLSTKDTTSEQFCLMSIPPPGSTIAADQSIAKDGTYFR